ncbi:MAG: DUF5020 family protein [Parabacteroides sp.]
MCRLLTLLLLTLFPMKMMAQDIQVHYDFGRHIYSSEESDRQKVTVTYEAFKADKLGSWYYFVDLDLRNQGASGAYTEVSREFNLGSQSPFAAHMEFDGGLNLYGSFQNAILVGPAYNGHTADFSKTWSVQLMYKQFLKSNEKKAAAGFQLTGVWGINWGDGKWTFSGFADLWSGYIPEWDAEGQKKGLVFLAEPQLWYNISKKISVGTEWEVSNNFIYRTGNSSKTFFFNPTLAFKFNL